MLPKSLQVGATGAGAATGYNLGEMVLSAVSSHGPALAAAQGRTSMRIGQLVETLATGKSDKAVVSKILNVRNASRGAAGMMKYLSVNFDPDDDRPPPKDKREAFSRMQEQLARINADPLAAQRKIHANLAELRMAAPEAADYLELQAIKLPMYLQQLLPKDTGTMTRMGKSLWQPSDTTYKRTAEYIKGAMFPLEVIEDAVANKLSAQAAIAFREFNPAHFRELQMYCAQNIEGLQKNLTFDQRCSLGTLVNIPLDPSQEPKRINFIQSMHVQAAAEAAQPRPPSATPKPEPKTKAQSVQE
jgi:hypothetical protein